MSSDVVMQTPRSSNISSTRIHDLAALNDARNYLEIRVSAGDTFVNVHLDRKTAVDPLFRFEIENYREEGTVFVSDTSDNYFKSLPLNEIFDVIFLDGMHTFEQTYRDFCNAILHSHLKTIILIDDTLPSDPFSAIKSPQECVSTRRLAGI